MDIRVVVCGHGRFGTGLHEAMKLLSGDDDRVRSLDFAAGDSFDELVERVEALVDDRVPTIICVDVVGGSPFKAAALAKMRHSGLRVVSGTNFPLLLGLVFPEEETDDVDALVSRAVEAARASLAPLELPA